MKITRLLSAAFVAISLAACANQNTPPTAAPGELGVNKTTGGALLGAGLGGLLGSQIGHGSGKVAATAAGTLLGGLAGFELGKRLDSADLEYAQHAQQEAYSAPIGQTISWQNPQTGHEGTFVATRNGTDQAGNYCREFRQTVNVDGQKQQAAGTACRQPDGTWKIVQ